MGMEPTERGGARQSERGATLREGANRARTAPTERAAPDGLSWTQPCAPRPDERKPDEPEPAWRSKTGRASENQPDDRAPDEKSGRAEVAGGCGSAARMPSSPDRAVELAALPPASFLKDWEMPPDRSVDTFASQD